MYQAHQTGWFGLAFLMCIGLVAALSILAHFGKLKLPNYVLFALIVLAILQILSINWLRVLDNNQLRAELMIAPGSVSNVVVHIEGSSREILATNKVALLFNQLQRVKAVLAHHSSPINSFDVRFERNNQEYQYRLGRDSARSNEYWVFETARAGNPGREIGRIESSSLGELLNALAHGKPVAVPQR